MTNKSQQFSVGLMNKLALALTREGLTPELLNAFSESPQAIQGLVSVCLDHATVQHKRWTFHSANPKWQRIPTCDYSGQAPELSLVDSNSGENSQHVFSREGSWLLLDGKLIRVHEACCDAYEASLSEGRKPWYDYKKVYEELRDVSTAGLSLMNFFLDHSTLIPDVWYGEEFCPKKLYFPNTIIQAVFDTCTQSLIPALSLGQDRYGNKWVRADLIQADGVYGEGLYRPFAIII